MRGLEGRAAGLVVPLFAVREPGDWGIGEISSLERLAPWVASTRHRILQLLPIAEMPPGERSPYAALSAFAIDPIYLSLDRIEDFSVNGGERALGDELRAQVDLVRADSGIDYDRVRHLKRRALEQAFAQFRSAEWATGSRRAAEFQRFRDAEAAWLPDYALFRVWQERAGWRAWTEWEWSLRQPSGDVLAAGRAAYEGACLFHEYVQWQAAAQWARARRAARRAGVLLVGDLPFMVARNSVDVWRRQDEFQCDASLGAPPDAFNAAGQQWGLPPYRWDTMAARNFAWLRRRVAHAAGQFDALRIDHVVGFYRMYVLPNDGPPQFVPAGEADQLTLGETLLSVVLEAGAGAGVLGEDLGVVPEFARASLARLGIPGYRVLRWEADGGVFRDPGTFPEQSIATTGTHDTSTLAAWWCEELDAAGRAALAAQPAFAGLGSGEASWNAAVNEALLDGVYAARSDVVLIPIQDAYGGRERVNTPATVGRANWDYRLPWTIADLEGGAGNALRERLRSLCLRHGR